MSIETITSSEVVIRTEPYEVPGKRQRVSDTVALFPDPSTGGYTFVINKGEGATLSVEMTLADLRGFAQWVIHEVGL